MTPKQKLRLEVIAISLSYGSLASQPERMQTILETLTEEEIKYLEVRTRIALLARSVEEA